MTQAKVKEISSKVKPVLKEAGVVRASLFGSVARGKIRKDSDIDILVDIRKDISLLEFVSLKMRLEEVLKKKVDLVEYDALRPAIKNRVLRQQIPIL